MTLVIPDGLYSKDGYGGKYIKKSTAQYYWGEAATPVERKWTPKAVIPQLETLIEAFDKTSTAIAGGAVLGSYAAVPYGDIDLFPLCKYAIKQAKQILIDLGYRETESSEFSLIFRRAGSHNKPVQMILLHHDADKNVQTLLNRFDLSICQLAIYGKQLHTNSIALRDVKVGAIRITGSLNIYSTLARVDKYQLRGFGIIDTPKDNVQKGENEKKNMG